MKKAVFQKIICSVLLITLALLLIVAAGYRSNRLNTEQQLQATLEKLFSCTLQQAEEYDALLLAHGASNYEISTEQGDDTLSDGFSIEATQLKEYLTTLFADSMTDQCINMIIVNRIFYRSAALSHQWNSNIETEHFELAKRSDGEGLYTFSVELKASADQSVVATAFGTIVMEENETERKIDRIIVTMKYL